MKLDSASIDKLQDAVLAGLLKRAQSGDPKAAKAAVEMLEERRRRLSTEAEPSPLAEVDASSPRATTEGEPEREVVLTWITTTGRTQGDAVDHFWPGLIGAEREKREARVRQWVRRARQGGTPIPAGHGGPRPAGLPPPKPTPAAPVSQLHPATTLEQIPAIERQVDQVERLIDDVLAQRGAGLKYYASLDRRRSEVRADLELARERERRIVKLERTPGAIAAELAKRQDAIALRAELFRRRSAREDEP